jgi:hypothetical protein
MAGWQCGAEQSNAKKVSGALRKEFIETADEQNHLMQ